MQRLAAAFKDVNGLHARIGTFLNQSSVLKIGIVPTTSRIQTASLLTALVSEPVQRTAWNEALANRPLTKDVLVTQSPEFSYVETQNSLVVYPVPFPGPAVEYLEANSLTDSYDHLKTCHMLMFVSESEQNLANIADPHFPWLRVVNANSMATKTGKQPDNKFDGELVLVDAEMALSANEKLQRSASNVNEFVALRKQSNINYLQHWNRRSVYEALQASIFATCEQQIAKLASFDVEKVGIKTSARKEWANESHHELQSTFLPALHRLLTRDLAFYKLYARSDDVEPTLAAFIGTAMPQSRANFQFLLGKASADRSLLREEPVSAKQARQEQAKAALLVSNLSRTSLRAVLQALSVQVPIGAVALAGHLFWDLSGYSMAALALLGVVSGLRQLQTKWLRATKQFESKMSDVFVDGIQQRERQLWEYGEQRADDVANHRAHLEEVLAQAKQEKNL